MEPAKRSVCQPRRATVHQRLFGDSARPCRRASQIAGCRRECHPVTKQHGDRRSAAHRLGLRQIGHVEPDAGRRFRLDLDPIGRDDPWRGVAMNSAAMSDGKNNMTTRAKVVLYLTATMIRIKARRMMMIVVVESDRGRTTDE